MGFVTDGIARAIVGRIVKVDPAECRHVVARVRQDRGGHDLPTAQGVVEHYARKAALQGLVTGVGSVPPFGLLMALVDTRGVAKMRVAMAASVATTRNPAFLDGSGWQEEILQVLAGQAPEAGGQPRRPVQAAKRAGRVLAKELVTRQGRKWTQRVLTRWLAKRAAERFAMSKLVPFASGAVGAAWNYVEIRRDGSRVLRTYFA